MSCSIRIVNQLEDYIKDTTSTDYRDFDKLINLFTFFKNNYGFKENEEYFILIPDMDDAIEISGKLVKHIIDNYDSSDEDMFRTEFKLSQFSTLKDFISYLKENYEEVNSKVGYFRFVLSV